MHNFIYIIHEAVLEKIVLWFILIDLEINTQEHVCRYFIVIDDIWDENVWQLIKCAFPRKSPSSRLISTTRSISVSKECCSSSDDIYRMGPLSHNVSRRLFCKRVFSHEKQCPNELVQISEDILQKCGGAGYH